MKKHVVAVVGSLALSRVTCRMVLDEGYRYMVFWPESGKCQALQECPRDQLPQLQCKVASKANAHTGFFDLKSWAMTRPQNTFLQPNDQSHFV